MAEAALSEAEIEEILANIDQFSPEELAEIDRVVDELATRQASRAAYNDLLAFCKHMDPDYKVGAHHKILAKLLMQIEAGEKDRICVNIAPRHGKSHLVSTMYPAWFLGRNPGKKVMLVSHTTDLAVDFGRKVRNLISTPQFQQVFPNVSLAVDSKSAGRWNTNHGGEFFACGVGSALAGRGAHMLIVDDPHSEQDVLNGNFEVFERAYQWFTYGARTRLMPGGAVAICQCMTGDTEVLLWDGKPLRLDQIRPGDVVASYDGKGLVPRRVLNWAEQGLDHVYSIRMSSGVILRANARHPFLVQHEGREEWIQTKLLSPGMVLTGVKPPNVGTKSTPEGFASTTTIAHAEKGPSTPLLTGVSGVARPAVRTDAKSQCPRRGCASSTTTKRVGKPGLGGYRQRITGTAISSTGTASRRMTTTRCWAHKAARALSVSGFQKMLTYPSIGRSSRWITVTIAGLFADSYATTATSSSSTESPTNASTVPLSTFEMVGHTIEEIRLTGVERVYDLQVDGTENFVANGVVSHNTRWHLDDLTGRVVGDMAKNPGADQYEVVEFPAILETPDPETGEVVEKALWPEFFDLKALYRTKASMPPFQWNSQYQQRPTAEEAAIIKRDWWNPWVQDDPPDCEYIIMTLDAAAETHNRADFTAITTWGVFFNEETDAHNVILLNSIKERFEFPELKRKALEEYTEWEPDSFIVEKKSAGTALYQELRRMGMPVQEYTPHRGSGDKLARLNSVTDIVASGLCWVPRTRWAEELVDEVAAFPFASHDDLCLARGTKVLMADGNERPIEAVSVGEYVMTPVGPRPVLAAGFTGYQPTTTLHVVGGQLSATFNHPVATSEGWVEAGQVDHTSVIVVASISSWMRAWLFLRTQMSNLRSWCSTAVRTEGTLTAATQHTDVTLAAQGGSFIEMCGSSTTDQSQTATKFTTSMKTLRTTMSTTWLACLGLSIEAIGTLAKKSTLLRINSASTSRGSAPRLLNGIDPKKGARGTASTRSGQYVKSTAKRGMTPCQRLSGYVNNAAVGLWRLLRNAACVLLSALAGDTGTRSARPNWQSLGLASSAGESSTRSKPRRSIVRESVVSSITEKGVVRPVFNLSVADAKCYFANGVLVHNCDATVMALMRFRQGGFIRLPSDEPDDVTYFRRREAFY